MKCGLLRAGKNADEDRENAPAFSMLSVIVPSKWIFFVAPDHPAYVDVLAQWLQSFDLANLQKFAVISPEILTDPRAHLLREYIKIEIERRKT